MTWNTQFITHQLKCFIYPNHQTHTHHNIHPNFYLEKDLEVLFGLKQTSLNNTKYTKYTNDGLRMRIRQDYNTTKITTYIERIYD